jgi:hypothetical protein
VLYPPQEVVTKAGSVGLSSAATQTLVDGSGNL